MPTEWCSVGSEANHFPCDFCEGSPVGWLRVKEQDRSLGGYKQQDAHVFMVCAEHIKMAGVPGKYGDLRVEAVYPQWREEPRHAKGTGQDA